MVSHYARAYTFVSYVVKSSKICNDSPSFNPHGCSRFKPSISRNSKARAWLPLKHFGLSARLFTVLRRKHTMLRIACCSNVSVFPCRQPILPAFSVTLPQREAAWKSAKSLMAGWGLSEVVTFFRQRPHTHNAIASSESWDTWPNLTWYDLSGSWMQFDWACPCSSHHAGWGAQHFFAVPARQTKKKIEKGKLHGKRGKLHIVAVCSWGHFTI